MGIDQENLWGIYRICGRNYEKKAHLLLDYTDRPGDVADPWYTDDFDAAWRDVEEGCLGLLETLQ